MTQSTSGPISAELSERCAGIDLLVLDVDGVLTDGTITIDERGVEIKHFHVRDGAAVGLWRRAGKQTAILSGRSSAAVDRRAAELAIAEVIQGAFRKIEPFRALIQRLGVEPRRVCYVGDDLADLPPLRLAGLAACPADAAPEVLSYCQLVTRAPGGRGAVREVVEVVLKAQGLWDGLVREE